VSDSWQYDGFAVRPDWTAGFLTTRPIMQSDFGAYTASRASTKNITLALTILASIEKQLHSTEVTVWK